MRAKIEKLFQFHINRRKVLKGTIFKKLRYYKDYLY